MRTAFAIVAVMLTLAACGGEGNGGKPVSMSPPPGPFDPLSPFVEALDPGL